jgi:hypothetical protein
LYGKLDWNKVRLGAEIEVRLEKKVSIEEAFKSDREESQTEVEIRLERKVRVGRKVSLGEFQSGDSQTREKSQTGRQEVRQ